MYTSNPSAVKSSVWGGVPFMSRPAFHSIFADEINQYLDYKIASGFSEKSFSIILKSFEMLGQKNGKQKQRHPTMPGSTRSKSFWNI